MCRTTVQQALLADSRDQHRQWKRRSADVGGLRLAMGNNGQGRGWAGAEIETQYAELLSDMYHQTLNAVNDHDGNFIPTSLPKTTRSRLIRTLDCWHFEPHMLSDEEVFASTLILFEALYRIEGFEESVGVSLEQLSRFLHHLRKIYRYENQYHNYEHALDVLQATQCYLVNARLVPAITILLAPQGQWKSTRQDDSLISLLRLRDIFAVYLAAIGHDVGHPGLTNVFMEKAQAPLSELYPRSALENLHYQLLTRVMRHHGLGVLFDDPSEGQHFRALLSQTILATDMSVHTDFMKRFQDEVDGQHAEISARRLLVSQALLKNADISNPSRPFPVAYHWATALMEEWLAQKRMEEFFSVETSVYPSSDPVGICKSQVFFISTFAKPLLDITVKAVPELGQFAQHCGLNLGRWETRLSDLKSGNNVHSPPTRAPPTSPRQPADFQTAFPLTLPHGSSVSFPPSYTLASSVCSDSAPISPTDTSSVALPASDFANQLGRVLSPTGSESSGSSGHATTISTLGPLPTLDTVSARNGTHAIRAAAKMGTLQPRRNNRNSWCVQSSLQQSFAQASPPLAPFSPMLQSPVSTTGRDGLPPPPITAPPEMGGSTNDRAADVLGGVPSIGRSKSHGAASSAGDMRQE